MGFQIWDFAFQNLTQPNPSPRADGTPCIDQSHDSEPHFRHEGGDPWPAVPLRQVRLADPAVVPRLLRPRRARRPLQEDRSHALVPRTGKEGGAEFSFQNQSTQ